LQFAPANTNPKIAKEYVLPTHTSELTLKQRKTKQAVEGQPTTTVTVAQAFDLAKHESIQASIRCFFIIGLDAKS